MQEIIFDVIDDCSNFKVLIVNFLNLEYFDFDKKRVIIHDDEFFELKKINGTIKWLILNGVGISSVDMLDHNLVDDGLTKICRMYQ